MMVAVPPGLVGSNGLVGRLGVAHAPETLGDAAVGYLAGTASTGSSLDALNVCVAPYRFAASSLRSRIFTVIIG